MVCVLFPLGSLRRFQRPAGLFLITTGSMLIFLAGFVVALTNQPFPSLEGSETIYSFSEVLPFSFRIDRLSGVFLSLIGLVSFAVGIYSFKYIEHYSGDYRKNILITLHALFLTAMVVVVSSSNFFTFLFGWEFIAISNFFLVMFDYESKDTRKAGLYYFIMTQMSTLFILTGFLTIFAKTGTLNIQRISLDSGSTEFIFLCLFLAFGIKAGVVPFQKWLPYAHPAAPANISALLSGLTIKVPIYALIRLLSDVLTPTLNWGILILLVGVITAVLGIIYAFKEPVLKRMLAYSSIENIGVVLTGVGLWVIFTTQGFPEIGFVALVGAVLHAINHGIFKSLLFLGAGAIVMITHSKNMEELGGLIKFMPYTGVFFLVGALSISALPPFNGFVSEVILFQVFLQAGVLPDPALKAVLIIALAMFALTSALAGACFVKAFGTIFLGVARTEKSRVVETVPNLMRLGQGILAVFCIVLGLFSSDLLGLLGYRIAIPNMLLIGIPLLLATVLISVFFRYTSNRTKHAGETWGCGILFQHPTMEYTPTGFSEPVFNIFTTIYRTKKNSRLVYFDKQNSIVRSGSVDLKLIRFFEEYLYNPIVMVVKEISRLVASLENDNSNTYILYVFLGIFIIFLLFG